MLERSPSRYGARRCAGRARAACRSFALGSALALIAIATHPLRILASPDRLETEPVPDLRDGTPELWALTGSRIVPRPGVVIENGTIVVDGTKIVAVESGLAPPAGARVVDLAGKTVYAGFIDGYETVDASPPEEGVAYWNPEIRPRAAVASSWSSLSGPNDALRSQGIVARLVAPRRGIVRGASAVVATGTRPRAQSLLLSGAALHVGFVPSVGGGPDGYPRSPMGAVALLRQAFHDVRWLEAAQAASRADSRLAPPERNDDLVSLSSWSGSERLVIASVPNERWLLLADSVAREFALPLAIHGSGREYRRIDAVRETGRPIIVPLDFPQPPDVGTAEAALDVELEDLLHWDYAPENPARLAHAGVRIAFTSDGLDDRRQFLERVRRAVKRGLEPDAALEALTITPAELFGVARKLGTLEPGKLASFVITDGDLFAEKTKVLETWVLGERFELEPRPWFDITGTWSFDGKLHGTDRPLILVITRRGGGYGGELRSEAGPGKEDDGSSNISVARIALRDGRLALVFPTERIGGEGFARLSAVVERDTNGALSASGRVIWPDGEIQPFVLRRTGAVPEEKDAEANDAKDSKPEPNSKPESEPSPPPADESASFPLVYPLGAFGRESAPEPEDVLFRDATVWTCGPDGVIDGGDVLVSDGKVVAVGRDLDPPEGTRVVSARGKHITPGLIDCHSHMATDGGINEGTQSITAEVRIGDFIDSDDIDIYRQLAGGLTAANILHGSANPIGGQNQVIKLRWGLLPAELKLRGAPPGIKFALGENVKRSNWGDPSSRYPQSRMGVEQLFRDAFEAARAYDERRRNWERDPRGLPPRRDLELDTLAEILRGERWIHCHSYRQDEILALLRVLDDFGVRIGTFQHILEGYKVADAMAQHGAMASGFSDWWAYKFEVYDAIPYNGALMYRAGIVVSFNSDDRELARHLNHEAAKAVKYGGVPEERALEFVTLNPAKQLRIDDRVGSLEPGKDADFVVWSGHPLSCMPRCEETWVDGRRFFSLDSDRELRESAHAMRVELVQKVLRSREAMLPAAERKPDPVAVFRAGEGDACLHGVGGE